MKRTFSPEVIQKAVDLFPEGTETFDPSDWLSKEKNIAITNDKGDVILLDYQHEKVYCGHWFFFSRGRQAIEAAEDAGEYIFNKTPCEVIIGATPLQKLGARWLSKKMGFTSYGVLEYDQGPCELLILTKKEYQRTKI